MSFSENVKIEAKKKAFFRCVVCHDTFVEVHHIIPQSEGGEDTLDNAAPLCAKCHDLYGGNPYKRKQLKLIRDDWYEKVEMMTSSPIKDFEKIEVDSNAVNALRNNKVAIYHAVLANESFTMAARMIHRLVYSAQKRNPNQRRVLYLDIDGHRNKKGGFDGDMFELQTSFIMEHIMPYLSEIHMPLGSVENKKLQKNDIPDEIEIYGYEE